MKKKRYTDEQIAYALRQAEAGAYFAEVEQSFREKAIGRFGGFRTPVGAKRRSVGGEGHLRG
jgi:hypothetical protein